MAVVEVGIMADRKRSLSEDEGDVAVQVGTDNRKRARHASASEAEEDWEEEEEEDVEMVISEPEGPVMSSAAAKMMVSITPQGRLTTCCRPKWDTSQDKVLVPSNRELEHPSRRPTNSTGKVGCRLYTAVGDWWSHLVRAGLGRVMKGLEPTRISDHQMEEVCLPTQWPVC